MTTEVPPFQNPKLVTGPAFFKTKNGEIKANTGDVVVEMSGHPVVLTRAQYEALGNDYYEVVTSSLLEEALAHRRDGGQATPPTEEEMTEIETSVSEQVAERQAADELKAEQEAAIREAVAAQPFVIVDSNSGPPTATPSLTATAIPNPAIPIDMVGEPFPEEPGGGEEPPVNTATAGAPGSFSGETPADFAGLSGVVASPTTKWTVGQYVTLGDASSAYWDGTMWAVGTAPVV